MTVLGSHNAGDPTGGRGNRPEGAREWQLHWLESPDAAPGLHLESDDLVGLSVGSADPSALKAFASEQAWPGDMVVRLSLRPNPDGTAFSASAHCRLSDFLAWDPTAIPLPTDDDTLRPAPSRANLRLEFLRTMRMAVDKAVEALILPSDDAAGLMLAVRDMLDKAARDASRAHPWR